MDDSGAARTPDLFGHADPVPSPAPSSVPSDPGRTPAPTQRQMAYALDISRALRVPMPLAMDAAGVGAFIDMHREALRALRWQR